MNTDGPRPLGALKARVHEFAEQVASHLNVGPASTLEPVVSLLGGKLQPVDPFGSAGGAPPSIEVRSMRDFTIFLPTTTSAQRDRFTIAHELGHLFLHYTQFSKLHPGKTMVATRWVDSTDAAQQRCEWEANWFAAAFLMKASDFRSIWEKRKGDASLVAIDFDVSEKAAMIRASGLGLT